LTVFCPNGSGRIRSIPLTSNADEVTDFAFRGTAAPNQGNSPAKAHGERFDGGANARLRPGQRVRVEIEGIGVIENPVVAEPSPVSQ
jgi:2-keto-4-pentenoate hydratase/2-oxohepta-3-ene-1,7-dioic acid hydratase in catechol pathway